ncbi:MAG: YraN family protein [Candidatus Caenarcaniphilales bacterium]|nr:YraN family protein [Candidatus Caenarcaniphilales bacterium]
MNWEKGQKYEHLAERYLHSKGYSIVERNWHAGNHGELDLVCKKDKNYIFIEVKGRSSNHAYEDALNSITPWKAKKLMFCMRTYLDHLEKKRIYSPKNRFDVVVVCEDKLSGESIVDHIENVNLWDLLENSKF